MKYLIIFILSLLCLRGSVRGARDLVLSEVYLKGNADRLEISNIGDETFTGIVTLSGATTIGAVPDYFDVDNLVVTGGQAVVIARYGLSSYDYFQNIGVIGAINSKLVLSATGRDISLWYQGTLLDQFIVDYPTIQSNDTTSSFSKREKFGAVSVSSAQDSRNVNSGYIASPGSYLVPAPQQTGEVIPSTGEIDSGVCIQDSSKLRISEIYFGDENHDPFIELQGLSDFQGQVTLSGSVLGLSFTIDLNITQSGYLVLSRGANGLLAGPDQISESALLLYSSGGTLVLSGQGGQVFDSVQIPPLGSKNVFYGGQGDGCQHSVQEGEKFSPGFDERFLFYFSGSNSSTQGVVNSTGSCPVCSVCSNDPETDPGISNPPSTGNLISGMIYTGPQELKILALDLTSNSSYQTITIQSTFDSSVVFSSSSPYRLHSINRSTNNVLYGTIAPGENKQFTGNRRFPTTANCIQLLSGTEIVDTYCYGNSSTGDENTTPNSETDPPPLTGNSITNYIIKITSIDFDPEGTDAGNEKIGLILLSGDSVNLKDFDLKIGTQNHHLSGTLFKGIEQIFQGTFGFPNSSKSGQNILVSLAFGDYIFDSYSYNPKNSLLSGEELEIDDLTGNMYSGLEITIKNILPNPKGKDQGREYLTLIFYVKDKVGSGITIPNPIDLSDGWYLLINEKKKKLTGSILLNHEKILTGKFAIPNKAACIAIGHADRIFDRLCYDLPQENELIGQGKQVLEDLSNTDSALLGQVSLRQIADSLCVVYMDESLVCRKIPPGKTSIRLKNENKLYKNYITLIEGYLDKDRKLLLQNTKLGEYISIFQEAKKGLKNGQQKILVGNSWVDVYDLKEQLALKYTLPSVQQMRIEIPQILKRYVSFVEELKSYSFLNTHLGKKPTSDDIMATKTSATNYSFFE